MSGRPNTGHGRWTNYDLEAAVKARKNAILHLVSTNVYVTRQTIKDELHLSEYTIFYTLRELLAEQALVDVKCKFGEGGAKQRLLKLPNVVKQKNWFEGWKGAPALGLAGWESIAPQETNIIHLTSYST